MKKQELVKYSEMADAMVMMRALQRIRGTILCKNDASEEEKRIHVNLTRLNLAKKQHKEIHNIESFKELEKCEKICFTN